MSETKRDGRGVPLPTVVERLAGCSTEEIRRLCPRPVLVELPTDAILPTEPRLGSRIPCEERDRIVKARLRALVRDVAPPHTAVHPLPASPAYVGRHPLCNAYMSHACLAPRHARFDRGDRRWEVSDLESKTGTTLEGRRLPTGIPTPLWGGEVLCLGGLRLLVLFPRQLFGLVRAVSRKRSRTQKRERGQQPLPAAGLRWGDLRTRVEGIGLETFVAGHQHPFLLETEPDRNGIGKTLPPLRFEQRRLHGLQPTRPGAGLIVGRTGDCDVAIDLASISARHAELRTLRGGRWGVMDLESSNGTSLDGRRLPPGVLTPVHAGQVLGFSVYRATFVTALELNEMLSPEVASAQGTGEGRGEVGFPLEGQVEGVAEFQDLLVRLERSQRTGTLRLRLDPGEAEVVFCLGRVIAARCGTRSGLEALERLCLRDRAKFAFAGSMRRSEGDMDLSIWSYLCTELGTAQILRAGLDAMREGGALREAG